MAPHSSTLAWKNPRDRGASKAAVHGVTKSWTQLSNFTFTFMHWRRKWQPTPVFCLENPREGGAWWAAIYGVAQSRTQLKQFGSSNSACEMPETIVRSQKGAKWGLQPPLPLGQEQSTVLNIFICKRVLWLKYWVGQKVHLRFCHNGLWRPLFINRDHCFYPSPLCCKWGNKVPEAEKICPKSPKVPT